MVKTDSQNLPNRWAQKIKRLYAAGDQQGVADLVDSIKQHVDQIDVFEGQWQQILEGAAVCGLPVEITKGQALALFHRQDGRCALTGLPISFRGQGREAVWKASSDAFLDRLDASRGYVPGNVWWLHRDASRIKTDLPLARLLELCRLIVNQEATGAIVAPPGPSPLTAALIEPSTAGQVVAQYLRDRVENDPLHRETSAALWQCFLDWCFVNGVKTCSRTAFGLALRSLGYENEHLRVITWRGLRLLPREGCEGEKNLRMEKLRS